MADAESAEQKYLLCLLSIAEELLALMPPEVQRKYGLIKGTLAVKLGSDINLEADSAILASLTTGIQPQVSSATRFGHAAPDCQERATRFNIPEPSPQVHSAGDEAIVRSLDSELAPVRLVGHHPGSAISVLCAACAVCVPSTSHPFCRQPVAMLSIPRVLVHMPAAGSGSNTSLTAFSTSSQK